MSVSNPYKSISPAAMDCRGTAAVTLRFDAAAELASDPADIVLIMDRSYSMTQRPMFFARQGVNALISMVAAASSGNPKGDLGNGSRIGIVSFSSTATTDLQLTERREPMTRAIASLYANGETNHAAAFTAAEKLLGPKSTKRRIAVMFTDGITTLGGDAVPITDRMKADGIEIFCIGLMADPSLLESWPVSPSQTTFPTQQMKKNWSPFSLKSRPARSSPGPRML